MRAGVLAVHCVPQCRHGDRVQHGPVDGDACLFEDVALLFERMALNGDREDLALVSDGPRDQKIYDQFFDGNREIGLQFEGRCGGHFSLSSKGNGEQPDGAPRGGDRQHVYGRGRFQF